MRGGGKRGSTIVGDGFSSCQDQFQKETEDVPDLVSLEQHSEVLLLGEAQCQLARAGATRCQLRKYLIYVQLLKNLIAPVTHQTHC